MQSVWNEELILFFIALVIIKYLYYIIVMGTVIHCIDKSCMWTYYIMALLRLLVSAKG